MRNPLRSPWACSGRIDTAKLTLFAFAAGCGSIQAAGVVLPTAPSGFSSLPVETSPTQGFGEDLLAGLSISTSLSGTYDSNVTQSPGEPVAPITDDFILSLGGSVNYLSKASDWTFGGNYRGSYNEYFNQSDFNGYNQGAGLVANYDGGRFNAALTGGIDFDQGTNRNYSSAFVERTNYRLGLTARYRMSPKTSLQGNLGQNLSTTGDDDFDDTESFDAGVSALWKYSPLTELGPGIRYTYRSGSSQTGRTSIGPTVNLNYQLSTKVALNSRLGMDFASYDDGSSADPSFSASIGLNYQASKLWGLNFSLYNDTQADPSVPGAFTEVTSMRLGYRRKLRRATLNLGLGLDTNRSENPTSGVGNDRDYLNIDASLGMPLFSNTSFGSIFLRYADQSSSATDSWDSFQMGLSINRRF